MRRRKPRPAVRKVFICDPRGEIEQSDVEPKGSPETIIRWKHQEHLGLDIKGQELPSLGMLAIRCELDSLGEWMPLSMAIVEESVIQQVRQSVHTSHLLDPAPVLVKDRLKESYGKASKQIFK